MAFEEVKQLRQEFANGVLNLRDFEPQGVLGVGELGRVTRARHRKSGAMVAVKELLTDGELSEDLIEDFCREVRVLYSCRFPFVLGIIGFTIQPPFAIVTPYVDGGSLFEYVKSSGERQRLDATQKTLVAAGVAYGMSKLHEANIIHRNLKSRNILLDGRLLPFVSDFGVARTVEGKSTGMTRNCGTVNWSAPEQMESYQYDNKVDLFSFGGVLYELLCHQIPFEGLPSVKVATEVCRGRRPTLPDGKEKSVVKAIKECWEADPKKRPTFQALFEKIIAGKIGWEGTNSKALSALKKIIKEAESQADRKKTKGK
jgi:serine/threonine protein kinase